MNLKAMQPFRVWKNKVPEHILQVFGILHRLFIYTGRVSLAEMGKFAFGLYAAVAE